MPELTSSLASLRLSVFGEGQKRLLNAGPALSALYRKSTSQHGQAFAAPLVTPGQPLVLLRLESEINSALPIEMAGQENGIYVQHSWPRNVEDSYHLCTLRTGIRTPRAVTDEAVTHIQRLHSEYETFASVLRRCADGTLKPEESDLLRDYLHRTSKRLLRTSMGGYPQASLIEQIASARASFAAGEIASLRQALDRLKPSLGRLVTDAAGRSLLPSEADLASVMVDWTRSEGILVMIDKSVRVGGNLTAQGAVGSDISITGSNFSQNDTPLSDAASELTRLIATAGPSLGQHEESLTEAANEIEELSRSETPRRSKIALLARGVLATARIIGDTGAPIARTVEEILALTT